MRENLFQKQAEKCNVYKHTLSHLHIFDTWIYLISIRNNFHRILQKIEIKDLYNILQWFWWFITIGKITSATSFFLPFFSFFKHWSLSLKSHYLNRNARRGRKGNRRELMCTQREQKGNCIGQQNSQRKRKYCKQM